MIPYFQWQEFFIGPVPIQVWGLMVALGIGLGLGVSVWMAKQQGLEHQHVIDAAFWIIISSLVMARVVYVVSEWSLFAGSFGDVVKIWEGGMSISGGYAGAAIAAWLYLRAKKLKFWDYADSIIFGLPLGLFIGRLGCFFIIDHPGRPTSFFLGQEYVDGIVRHNHGLYLSLNGLLLMALFFAVWKWGKNVQKGAYIALFLIEYGIVRFILDFFRATDLGYSDSRFFGLTVAQYLSLLMVVLAAATWYYVLRKPQETNT